MASSQPRYKLASPPGVPPVSIDELKLHLRVEGNHDDVNVEAALDAATGLLDGWTGLLGRCIIRQQWQGFYPIGAPLTIDLPDVIAVSALDVFANGAWTSVPAQDWRWEFYAGRARVVASKNAAPWPMADDVHEIARITFDAGYGAAASDVPPTLRTIIRMIAGAFYEHRGEAGADVQIIDRFHKIIAPFRRL